MLGVEYYGWLLHDGWAAYYLFALASHQSCLEHWIRRVSGQEWGTREGIGGKVTIKSQGSII